MNKKLFASLAAGVAILLTGCGLSDSPPTPEPPKYQTWGEYADHLNSEWDRDCGFRDEACYNRNIRLVKTFADDTGHLGTNNEFAELLPRQIESFTELHESATYLGCYMSDSACIEALRTMSLMNENIPELALRAN